MMNIQVSVQEQEELCQIKPKKISIYSRFNRLNTSVSISIIRE